MDKESCVFLTDALSENTSLKSLYFGQTGMKRGALLRLADFLLVNETLENFDVGSAAPSLDAVEKFIRILASNSSLKHVAVSTGFFFDEGDIDEQDFVESDDEEVINDDREQECYRNLVKMLERNATLHFVELPWQSSFRPNFDLEEKTMYYLRLNQIGRKKMLSELSRGTGRDFWVEALIDNRRAIFW